MSGVAGDASRFDRYVVTVAFEVHPEHLAKFRVAMQANARTSLLVEPGCLVFDVCEASDRPAFFLYELYADEAAFDVHLQAQHFKDFDSASSAWVVSKHVARFQRLSDALPTERE